MSATTHNLAADLIETTLTQVGKEFSETPRTPDEVAHYADAMADMFEAWLERLAKRPEGGRAIEGGR